jgi:hypothetical protein
MPHRIPPRIITHLQSVYTETGRNDAVEWRGLVSKLGITEEELRAGLHWAFTVGGERQLERIGPHHVRLGPTVIPVAQGLRPRPS